MLRFHIGWISRSLPGCCGQWLSAAPELNRPLWALVARSSDFHTTSEEPDYTTIQSLKRRPNPTSSLKIATQREAGLILMYGALLYAGYTAVLSTLSTQLSSRLGFNSIEIGLCYLPLGVGSMGPRWAVGRLLDWNFRREARRQGIQIQKNRQQEIPHFNVERARLSITLPMIYGSSFCILAYGWVMEYRTGLAGPLVMLFLTGLTITEAFNTLNTLVVDINYETPATAVAANKLFRCLMGAGSTGIVGPLTNAIGIGWTGAIIASLWVLLSPGLWTVLLSGS